MSELIWSFAPWIVFLLANRFGSLYEAAAAGAVAALVVVGRAVRRRQLHLLETAGLVYFLALLGVLLTVHPEHLATWARYAQAGSHAALTVIVLGSLVVGRPFTESYARAVTPAEVWDTSEFRAINRHISAVWGLAFLVGTISLVVAGSVDSRQILLRVVVPFGALALAYRYTESQHVPQELAPTVQHS